MLDDGRVQCDICPRQCRLREGQRGFCFVRGRVDEDVVLTTYGRSSGFCIDPIEKKPLNHFLPGTPVLSFGTAGCNLDLQVLPELGHQQVARVRHARRRRRSPAAIARRGEAGDGSPQRRIHLQRPDDLSGVRGRHRDRLSRAGGANGGGHGGLHQPGGAREFFGHVDAANVDLKAFTEDFYREVTFSELAPVLETLEYIAHETDVWLELTTLLIPGANDSPEELDTMTRWVVEHLGEDVPMHFSAFHPDFKMRDHGRTPVATLVRAREIARANGVRYAYTGNVHNPAGDTTLCPQCDAELIKRDWYDLHSYRVDDGKCAECGFEIAGVFEQSPGTWGRRRERIRPGDWANEVRL